MDIFINICLLVMGFIGSVSAIGGDTWNKGDKSVFKRITTIGWVSVIAFFLVLGLGIYKEIRTQAQSTITNERHNKFRESIEIKLENIIASNTNCGKATEIKEIANKIEEAKVVAAPHKDLVFIYTATYFIGQRNLAFNDALQLKTKLKKVNSSFDVSVYERDDGTRWAVVVGDLMPKSDISKFLRKFKKQTGLSAYPNLVKNWKPIEIKLSEI